MANHPPIGTEFLVIKHGSALYDKAKYNVSAIDIAASFRFIIIRHFRDPHEVEVESYTNSFATMPNHYGLLISLEDLEDWQRRGMIQSSGTCQLAFGFMNTGPDSPKVSPTLKDLNKDQDVCVQCKKPLSRFGRMVYCPNCEK